MGHGKGTFERKTKIKFIREKIQNKYINKSSPFVFVQRKKKRIAENASETV